MKLEELPFAVDPDPACTKRQVSEFLIAEGRAAYQAYVDVCPRFKDPDMRIDWSFGWRWESEERPRKKLRKEKR